MVSTSTTAAATVSPWVPVLAAAVGAGAALIVGTLTQLWTGHRENVRWSREKTDRKEQWEREDQARREQWQREDVLRWLQERQQAYARFVAVLFEWDDHLGKARTDRKMDMQYNMRTKIDWSEINRLRRAAHDELALVQFMAPPGIREAAGSAVTYREAFHVVYLEPEAIHPKELDEGWLRVRKSRSALLAAMQENLGLEIAPEDEKG